jgi:hypothetical protein
VSKCSKIDPHVRPGGTELIAGMTLRFVGFNRVAGCVFGVSRGLFFGFDVRPSPWPSNFISVRQDQPIILIVRFYTTFADAGGSIRSSDLCEVADAW